MRIVFMGTPAFSATILETLCKSFDVVGVFTRPDAVRGRGKKLVASPVKEAALLKNIPVFEYSSFKSDEAFDALCALEPDVICVAAYGALLPKRVLDLPRLGCLNVHASLLPRWRGAAPIERAVLAGDEYAGISIMQMGEGLDTGDFCEAREVRIGCTHVEQLTHQLAEAGAEALCVVLDKLQNNAEVQWVRQDEAQVTYAQKIEKHELDLTPELEACQALRFVMASNESHPCRCVVGGKGLAVVRAALAVQDDAQLVEGLEAGMVRFVAKRMFLGCAQGSLELITVKPDGKKEMEARAFCAGIQGIKQGGISWQAVEHD